MLNPGSHDQETGVDGQHAPLVKINDAGVVLSDASPYAPSKGRSYYNKEELSIAGHNISFGATEAVLATNNNSINTETERTAKNVRTSRSCKPEKDSYEF